MKIKKIAQTPGLVATVVDNLTSSSTIDALSANQGKALYDMINSNILNGTLLWHGEIGELNSTATLTDSANNYQFILVRGIWNNGDYATRCGILYPEYQTIGEVLINWSNSSYSYHYRLLF